MAEHTLVLVAVRCDHPREIRRRLETILAATATYRVPPDTTATVYAKDVDDLTAADLDRLAAFFGWDSVRNLNIGDVVQRADV